MWRTLWKLIIGERALSFFVSDKLTCGVISGVIWHGELFLVADQVAKIDMPERKFVKKTCWKVLHWLYLTKHVSSNTLKLILLLIRQKFLQTIFRRKNSQLIPWRYGWKNFIINKFFYPNEVLFRRTLRKNKYFCCCSLEKIPKRW